MTVLLTDHFNIQSTEERLTAAAAMLKRQRARCPQCEVSASLVFTGASAELFAQRNNGSGVVDAVRELVSSGLADIAYDGADEPTPAKRPQPNFRNARTPERRWLARIEVTEWFLNEFKDLIRGDPDPDRAGGLRKTIEVFGMPAAVHGVTMELGGDTELAHLLRQMRARAILPGLPEAHTYPARNLNGYRGAMQAVGRIVSADARCPAELYWLDGFLRLSETSSDAARVVAAYEGPEPLKKMIETLDRTQKHVIQVQLGHPGLYLPPGFEKTPLANPIRFGYENPKSPVLGPSAFRPRDETEAAFRAEEETVKWLIEEFIPANAGSHFVSGSALLKLAKSQEGSNVSAEKLRMAAADLKDRWQTLGNHPPDYAHAQGEYFSLADLFQLLTVSLAEFSRAGSLPASTPLLPVYGPFDMTDEQGPSGSTITRASVLRTCTELAPRLADTTWKRVPENRIPGWITIGEHRYNAAQFLRLIVDTYLSPQGPDMQVPTSQMWSGAGLMFPSSRLRADMGAVWTLKPAPLYLH